MRQEAFTAPIRWMRGRTVYEVLGDWPWLLVTFAAAAGAFVRRKRDGGGAVTASSPS
jgi:hypothetical protein